MLYHYRKAKINVKVLVILLLVVVGLGVSLFAARQIRRSVLSKMALEAGTTAYEQGDWLTASKQFQEYLGRNPDDVEILKKYAEARLSIRPLEVSFIGAAISAYRRVLQMDPADDVAYEKLALLYRAMPNYPDLAYIARRRIEQAPGDKEAPLWLAEALIGSDKREEARQTLETFIGDLEGLSDKHREYVRACTLMSQIVSAEDSDDAAAKGLEWLDRAVAYSPESVEALLSRAQFYRLTPRIRDLDATERLSRARRDLEAADAIGTDNPKDLFLLAREWMAHGQLDLARQRLDAASDLPEEAIEEYFLDPHDWTATKFSLAAQLPLQSGNVAESAALTDEVLGELTERRHRIQVLPTAIQVYVAANRAADARRCLDEYVEAQYVQEGASQSRQWMAYLRALVARAEDNAYAVIDILQPVVTSDVRQAVPAADAARAEAQWLAAQQWRLLAEAYGWTDQPRRAVEALNMYLALNPRDGAMNVQLAREYLKLRDWNRAFEVARRAEPLVPNDVRFTLLRIETGIYVATEGRPEVDSSQLKALSNELSDLRRDYPDRVDIRLLQATIAGHLGQPEEVERELKLAIEECAEPLRAEMQLVQHYARTDRPDEAVSLAQAACKRHAQAAEPWLSLAGLQATNGDYDAARQCLRQGLDAVSEAQEKRTLSLRLGLLELANGERSAGIDLLSELAEQDPCDVRTRALLLDTREIQANKARAQKLVDEVRAAEGDSGLQWRLHQASLWLLSDDWRSRRESIAEYLQYCIGADPAWSAPVLRLAQMYERMNDLGRVEDVYRQALARNPSAIEIVDRLMALLERQGRFSEAEQVLAQSGAGTEQAEAWHLRTALRSGDISQAIEELRDKVAGDDQDARSRVLLARLIYAETKDADQAFKYLAQAEAIAPESAVLVMTKAAILKAESRVAEARQVLDDYVTARDDFGAYLLRATYLAGEGEVVDAEKDYRKLTTFAEDGAVGYAYLSEFYAANNRLDDAVSALQESLRAYPEHTGLQRALMKAYFGRDQGQDQELALEMLADLEARMPQDPELMRLRAIQLLQEPTSESVAAAREKLAAVVSQDPSAVDAHLMLIRIAMQEGAYADAREAAIRGLGGNPDNPALLAARSRAELALDNTSMATQVANLALKADPNSAEARDIIVAVARKTQDRTLLEQARNLLDAGLAREPGNGQLLVARAQVMVLLQQARQAIPDLEAYCASGEGSRNVGALVTLADLYRLSGDAAKARETIDLAQGIDPNSQTVVHGRLLWLVSQERYDDLVGISSAYISAENQESAMVVAAGTVLMSLASTELKQEGLKLFEHAATRWPEALEARLGLASALYQMGNAKRAETIYRELLERNPRNIRILNDLAWILQEQQQRYDEALTLANRGLAVAPDEVHLLDTRGTILANMPNRLADAKRDFERLVTLSSANDRRRAQALLQLGRVCAKLNDPAGAKQQLGQALEIDRRIGVFTAEERAEIETLLQ